MNKPPPTKPHWHYGGTFDAAWKGTLRVIEVAEEESKEVAEKEDGERLLSWAKATLDAMALAHVVTLDPAQFRALPEDYDALTDFTPDPHLPFPILYVSINDPLSAGVLISSSMQAGSVIIVGFWGYDMDTRHLEFEEAMKQTKRIDIAIPTCSVNATAHTYMDWVSGMGVPHSDTEGGDVHESRALLPTMERALGVVRFLESSNVDFEDTPVSRQVRRQAQRKGAPISQRVYVRSPRYRSRGEQTEHEHIEFSHRFEVRGHYKHYGPDTRLFRATERDRPHKIIEHPTRGPMVRVWCPDYVKGPPDRPLIPKTRVYRNQDEAA